MPSSPANFRPKATSFLAAALVATAFVASAAPARGVTETTYASVQTEPNSNLLCKRGVETAVLHDDGTVAVERKGCAFDVSLPAFLADVHRIEGSGFGQAPRMFAIRNDSALLAWGDTRCGLLGNDETAQRYRDTPVDVGLRIVTDVVNGSWFSIARTGDGGVYTWGLNYEGSLGIGLGFDAPNSVACENAYYPVGHAYRVAAAVARPTQVSLSDIAAVAADRVTGYAVDRTGDVYEWGLIPIDPDPQPFGTFDTQPVPRKVQGLPPSIALVTSLYMKFSLAADGTVHGWGPNVVGNFGDGTTNPHPTPARVPGLANVVQIAASGDSPIVALLDDGTIRYWGGCCYFPGNPVPRWIRTLPTAPEPAAPMYSEARGHYAQALPPIYRVKGTGGVVLLYGTDGSLYQFPRSQTEPVFVLLSTRATPANRLVAVEYHHAAFDHYFVTASSDEITKLDAGMFAGWHRTGLAFDAQRASGRTVDVCRLFSASFGSRSSHFYAADSVECIAAKRNGVWTDEGVAFGTLLPDAAGRCPAHSEPIFRLYNGGQGDAPNHRYVKSLSVRNRMISGGWIAEGRAPLGVAMCMPA